VDDAADNHGLVCAFHLDPVQPFDGDALVSSGDAASRPRWLHFNVADARARRWLQEESGLPPAAVKALIEPDPRVHVERIGAGMLAVLSDVHHDFGTDPEGFGKIRV
jgi:zinc transporter